VIPAERDYIVLLHGQPGNAAELRQVVDAHGPSVDVVAPHRPSCGDNSSPAGGIERNLDWSIALVEADLQGRAPRVVAHPDLVAGVIRRALAGPCRQ